MKPQRSAIAVTAGRVLQQGAHLTHPHLKDDIDDAVQGLLLVEAADVDGRHIQLIGNLVQAQMGLHVILVDLGVDLADEVVLLGVLFNGQLLLQGMEEGGESRLRSSIVSMASRLGSSAIPSICKRLRF